MDENLSDADFTERDQFQMGVLEAAGGEVVTTDGKPVVLASRCAGGEVSATYAFPGGGASLIRMGAIPAGPRTAAQARMELVLALSAGVAYGGR